MFTLVSAALGLMTGGVIVGFGWLQPAIAQVTFEPPPGQDRPRQTAGGGSRGHGACWVNDAERDRFVVISGHTTASSHPTFEVQVPATVQESSIAGLSAARGAIAAPAAAEFNLFDENGVLIYEANHALPQEQTLVRIELPEEHPGLTAAQNYFWIFAVICNPDNRQMDASVSSMITRVDARE